MELDCVTVLAEILPMLPPPPSNSEKLQVFTRPTNPIGSESAVISHFASHQRPAPACSSHSIYTGLLVYPQSTASMPPNSESLCVYCFCVECCSPGMVPNVMLASLLIPLKILPSSISVSYFTELFLLAFITI